MTKQEQVILKAERGDGLTVAEVKVYQETVQPIQHVYGKYGTLKKKYLEEKGIDWTIADLPTYLHGVDKQATEMQEVLTARLSKSEQYASTDNFLENYRRLTAMQKAIEDEILSELVYVI